MCGIAGFYGFKDDKLIQKFSKQLAHRGPDGEGIFMDGDFVTLLNRRLAIIDVKGGDQPIFNEDGTIAVVYNGEIYNYLELRDKLQKAGHVFKTKSDTEVIIHGYEEWGNGCFDRLNGMFAIALYDKKKKKLVLARDHFGIKPLYYSIFDDKLLFSSEIKPVFYSGLIKQSPNDRIIYRYLKYRIHDDQKETFFKGIFRLMPGELLEIKGKDLQIKKYTSLKEDLLSLEQTPLTEDKIKNFKKSLVKAIKYRLISEVPVGTCLSGGLDSSTVVSVVNKLLKKQVSEAKSVGKIQKTFSAVFPGGANDEEKYIDKVIKNKNLKSFKVFPKPEKFFEEITDFIRTQEEPTISTGPYAQFKVMEEAHGKVTVLLDGQGSDEMMAGYLPYYFVYLRQLLKENNYPVFLKEVLSSLDVVKRYVKEKFIKSVLPNDLMNKEFLSSHSKETFNIENDNLKKRLVQDIFSNSLQSLLRYEDKNAMRFSIEGRVPFLDFNLIKEIFSLSDDAIIKNGWNKYILRKATESLLPQEINQRRNKIGFTTPEYEWFMKMKNKIHAILSSTSFGKRKYFNQPEVLAAFQEFIEGKNTDTMIFWRFMNVELWLREFFDKKEIKKKDVWQLGKANKGKKTKINFSNVDYSRYPIKTSLFKKGDNFVKKISIEATTNFDKLKLKGKWFLVVSEKVVAISQGRSHFIWDINPSVIAKILSRYVKRTPFGIGLGSPWTMQLAIQEAGLARILTATLISAITKPLGIGGMFYRIAGETVRSIDGPTEYSLYPSNVSAKLGPKNPQKAAGDIKTQIEKNYKSNFLGVVIIDANDIGRNILGNSTDLSDKLVEEIMRDNPMGQADEQTPLVIVNF